MEEAVEVLQPRQKRTMSSFQVFSKFIHKENAEESGEEILSRKCFQLWLETRESKVLHPEESFRRTLIAHIRGVYGRKPFSSSVESSLLRLLRAKGGVNAWARCFPSNVTNIGKRGFNKLGYHEEKALQTGKDRETSKKQKSAENSLTLKPRFSQPVSIDFNVSPQETGILEAMKLYASLEHGDLTTLCSFLLGSVPEVDLLNTYWTAKRLGHDLLSPALAFYLESQQYRHDPRLQDRSLLPPKEEQYFFSDRPIGHFDFNSYTWLIDDCDDAAKIILRRELKGIHIFNLMESVLQLIISYNKFFPIIIKEGFVWIRLRARRGSDDNLRGLLLKMTKEREKFKCEFQDQSEVDNYLLSIPMFL